MKNVVIVRAFGSEPVKMVSISKEKHLVYVASENSLPRVEAGLCEPIGVPERDVLPFDVKIFERLKNEWQNGNAEAAWREIAIPASRG